MDNKAYLDEIAVKGKKKFSAGPILTPLMLKLIIVGSIAVIVMIIVGSILGNKSTDIAVVHESVYARITGLLSDDGPIKTYYEKVRSSDVREYASSLISSLSTAASRINAVSSSIGLNTEGLSSEAMAENDAAMSEFANELETAYLNGTLDVTYASSTSYQLSMLISLEEQARIKTSNAEYAEALDNSIRDLTTLQKQFKKYGDTH